MTNAPQDPYRRMAEQVWDAENNPDYDPGERAILSDGWCKEAFIIDFAHVIRDHTAYPDCIGALEEARHALSGDKRQRVDNALNKAKGIEP